MSSLLLSNPFVAPSPYMMGYVPPSGMLAVAGAQGSAAGADKNDAPGSNPRGSNGKDMAFLAKTRAASAIGRPANASAASIITAQADPYGVIVPFGQNLPDFEMPKVLPTAPWFKEH